MHVVRVADISIKFVLSIHTTHLHAAVSLKTVRTALRVRSRRAF